MAEEWRQRNGRREEVVRVETRRTRMSQAEFQASTLMPSCPLLFLCRHSSARFFLF